MAGNRNRPNVIFFFTDQQRYDMAGVHGCPLDIMPNFDRMAIEGTHLYYSFTCQPVCGPARSSLQTGLYATNTGCFRNGIELDPKLPTLADHFRTAGYKTGYIGKWHLAPEGMQAVTPYFQGRYEYWLGANALEFTSDAYATMMYDGDGNEVHLPGYRVDALTDAAIRYIDEQKDTPFFLFLSYLEPHFQNHRDDYPAPVGYAEKYLGKWLPPDLAALGGTAHQHTPGYYGMIKRLDEALGRLLDALRSLDLLENTIVVFTSDHGNHFKTRNNEYKRSCHDSSIRIPTAIIGPGFDGGGRINALTSLVDLPPTVLDAAGISIPDHMEGHSILPLLHGRDTDWDEEVLVQISESQVGRCVRTKRWKYSVRAENLMGSEADSAAEYTEEFLYDLFADPYELNNLIGYRSHQKVCEVMQERLLKRMHTAGENSPLIISAPIVESGQKRVTEFETYQ